MTNWVQWVYYLLMGSKRALSGKIIFTLLATMLFVVACVGSPPEEPEPEVLNSIAETEPAVHESMEEPVLTEPQGTIAPVNDPIEGPEEKPPETPVPATEPPAVIFDPATVSAEVKELTFADVKRLIQNLNTIIQTKNYELWITNLTADYLEFWSEPETLARLSESPVLRRQNVTLTSLRDYFNYVVYPSRQNDRVDDIEFIGETRIKAIIINPKGERLVLYNLEKIGDTWKIANWR